MLFKRKIFPLLSSCIILISHCYNSYGLQNGDFENGQDGSWTEKSDHPEYPIILPVQELQDVVPRCGSWAAWLGGVFTDESTLSQSFQVPENATNLFYYFLLDSYETECGFDFADVKLGGITHSYDLCVINNPPGTGKNDWSLAKIDLIPYRGQRLKLMFHTLNDEFFESNFFIDAISISRTQAQYFITANAEGDWSGQVSADIGCINYNYSNEFAGKTTPLDEGTTLNLTAISNVGGTVAWNNCVSEGGVVTGNGTDTARCNISSINSNKTITAIFSKNLNYQYYLYLPLSIKS